MIRYLSLASVLMLAPFAALADELTLPGAARQLANRVSPLDSYALPLAVYADGAIPVRRFEGHIDRQTWRIDGAGLTTLQILTPLREQLIADGYDLVFECEDRACGGFDFRFQTEVVPAPDMHVDIRDYRFVSAVRGDAEAISLLVSHSRNSGYVQIIRASQGENNPLSVKGNGRVPDAVVVTSEVSGLIADLVKHGHVVLKDLEFRTGADALGPGPYRSLERLAEYLKSNPDQRIALVGHTDSAGTLAGNISLSKRRAASVRDRLMQRSGVGIERIEAEGMGYLAPIASNLTEEGRDANRRVEAILLSEN